MGVRVCVCIVWGLSASVQRWWWGCDSSPSPCCLQLLVLLWHWPGLVGEQQQMWIVKHCVQLINSSPAWTERSCHARKSQACGICLMILFSLHTLICSGILREDSNIPHSCTYPPSSVSSHYFFAASSLVFCNPFICATAAWKLLAWVAARLNLFIMTVLQWKNMSIRESMKSMFIREMPDFPSTYTPVSISTVRGLIADRPLESAIRYQDSSRNIHAYFYC